MTPGRRAARLALSLAATAHDWLARPLLRRPTAGQGQTLLMVRLDRIGDFLLGLPAASRIAAAARQREERVVLVVNADFVGWVAAIPDLADAVIGIDRHRFCIDPRYRLGSLRGIAALGANTALHLAWSRELALGDAVIRASGAARRMGWQGDESNASVLEWRLGAGAYTELLRAAPEPAEMRRNEAMLDHIGVPALPGAPPALPQQAVEGVGEGHLVVAPGARSPLRRWPAERFAAVALALHRRTGLRVLICGAAEDRGAAGVITQALGDAALDLTGRTSLPQLTWLVGRSRLVLANDSLMVHLAAYLGRPSVCILGGGHPGRFLDYAGSRLFTPRQPMVVTHPLPCFGCNWACTQPREAGQAGPCISGIAAGAVLAAALRTMEESEAFFTHSASGAG